VTSPYLDNNDIIVTFPTSFWNFFLHAGSFFCTVYMLSFSFLTYNIRSRWMMPN
jgi:hypothetical protein